METDEYATPFLEKQEKQDSKSLMGEVESHMLPAWYIRRLVISSALLGAAYDLYLHLAK